MEHLSFPRENESLFPILTSQFDRLVSAAAAIGSSSSNTKRILLLIHLERSAHYTTTAAAAAAGDFSQPARGSEETSR